jgi:hypothetical protein
MGSHFVIANIITELLGEGLSEVFSALISAVETIFGILENLGDLIAYGAITAWNALVTAIDAAIAFFFSLLPHFPTAPEITLPEALRWFNWMIPVGTILTIWSTMLGIFLTFMLLKIVLNWLKAA